MEINALDALNSAYVPFSSSSDMAPGLQREESAFGQLLKRAQNATATANAAVSRTDDGTPILKKTEIDKTDKLYELCAELETFLVKNLIKSMRSTVQKSNLIDSGFAGEMYEDMLYDEYAKQFARNAGFGFAELAYRDMTRQR